jgi:hypothetical protein
MDMKKPQSFLSLGSRQDGSRMESKRRGIDIKHQKSEVLFAIAGALALFGMGVLFVVTIWVFI